jgi:hypothetical protein
MCRLKLGVLGAVMFTMFATLALFPRQTLAQPILGVPVLATACGTGPVMVGGAPDTVVSTPDSLGFYSIFDGKSLKGWWEGCGGSHATDKSNGATWVADSTHQAIYSMQAAGGSGSVLTTNKSYTHYEMIFDFWSSFGNDAGVFNRTPANWRCYQTTLDYISGSSVGGAYGENSYASHNIDYYTFNATGGGANITVPTGARSWTTLTSLHNPTSFGCPSTGCTAANWTTVWSTTGWNQVRIKFYGGLTANTRTKMQAWVRNLSEPEIPCVPTYDDSLLQANGTPANPIGLQIHSGTSRWNGAGRGAWYRNIKIRPLTETGEPIIPTSIDARGAAIRESGLRVVSDALVGRMDERHAITVRDMSGRTLQRFAGEGGAVRYELAGTVRGFLLVEIRTDRGVNRFRLGRI